MTEFSRPVPLDAVGEGVERRIEATAAERSALARRFDLNALASISATLSVTPISGGYRVKGRVTADATQACVVSGEDVPAKIDEAVDLAFMRDIGGGEEVELESGDCDTLPLEGGSIDLGEIAAQTLGLALDPYPRASAEVLSEVRQLLTSEEEARRAANPFSVLRRP